MKRADPGQERPQAPWMALDGALRPTRGAVDTSAQASPASAVERRDFLRLAGIGAAAALAACERIPVRHAIPYLVPPEGITPGASIHYASTCSACPASCGLIAVVRDGRPVKLEGNPRHPISAGGLCALGQADLRALYDADRLRAPTLDRHATSWPQIDAAVEEGLTAVKQAGLRIGLLTPTLVSPTARLAADAFVARHAATHVEFDPDPETPRALQLAYGILHDRTMLPSFDLQPVEHLVILGLDSLATGPDPVGFAAAYAARRRADDGHRPLRHVQIEASLTLTGAAADERWQATARERRLVALRLLRAVARGTPGSEAASIVDHFASYPDLDSSDERQTRLADTLLSRRGHSLVLGGGDDTVEAIAVALLNRLLGNEGASVDLARPSNIRSGQDARLARMLDELTTGSYGALVVVGVDPVGQLGEGDALRAALEGLTLSVAITDRPHATAAACNVVAAAHHGLECWNDFEPRAGLLTLAQPAIRPLFETRHPFANLLQWSGHESPDYRDTLMDRWRREVLTAEPDFDTAWHRTLSSGQPVELAPQATAPAAGGLREALALMASTAHANGSSETSGAEKLELDVIAEVSRRDGSRSFVPWLQELPDPLTRVSWLPSARIAPKLAQARDLRDGDVVAFHVGDRSITLPVRVTPGQHPNVVAVPAGYGLRDGDPEHPERNAYRLLDSSGGRRQRLGLPVRLVRTGGHEALPIVQIHPTSEGRPIVHQVDDLEAEVHEPHHPEASLWPHAERSSPQWRMVIDLNSCTGCSACVVACQAENNIAVVGADEMRRNRSMHWLRIDRYFDGTPEEPDVLFEPMLCSQCDNAPCETVCPVLATVHSTDGLSQQVYNRCVGTRYCANNCPYKVRAFNWFDNQPSEPIERMVLNPDVVVRSRGVMEKCSFCVQRIQAARIEARRAGAEVLPEVQTACQQSCPARAISFGDGTDPESKVARQAGSPRAFRVLAELGIEPSVAYLARVRARNGGESSGHHS